jgi:2-phospho-L-lactate guanylyltransferase
MPDPSPAPATGAVPAVGASSPPHLVAIVPVGSLDGAKSRLGAVLDAEERLDLTLRLARSTIAAAVAAERVAEVLVITPEDTIRTMAVELGARPLLQRDSGLNHGLVAARGEALAAGASAILILPIDLPNVTAAAIDEVAAALTEAARPLVAIVPDRHGRGTNALLIAPPEAIDVCFGGDSALAHEASARAIGARLVVLGGPLALDLDTPDDLLLAEASLRADGSTSNAGPTIREPVDVG